MLISSVLKIMTTFIRMDSRKSNVALRLGFGLIKAPTAKVATASNIRDPDSIYGTHVFKVFCFKNSVFSGECQTIIRKLRFLVAFFHNDALGHISGTFIVERFLLATRLMLPLFVKDKLWNL